MRRIWFAYAIGWLAMVAMGPAGAEVRWHGLFTDAMVLQQGDDVPVFGFSAGEASVTVRLLDRDGAVISEGSADTEDGRWLVELDGLEAGGPFTLEAVAGDQTIAVDNVLVGEVWICSGQSNMQWPLTRTFEAEKAIAAADYPQIRLFTVPRRGADEPETDVEGSWAICSPETAADFSAVGYYFGRDLQQTLDVPVGLISSNVGGTPAEAWTSRETLLDTEGLDVLVTQYGERGRDLQHTSVLYNAMIAPLIPFKIQGAIWYQGESNAGRAHQYRTLFPTMITDWRTRWGYDFPFLLVQLAPFKAIVEGPVESDWAELRDAQLQSTELLERTGMAVITDVGEEDDIHPQKKEPVGARLALLARKIAYGQAILADGPTLRNVKQEGDRLVLTFDNVGDGLQTNDGASLDGALTGFTLAGADGQYANAEAKIVSKDTIEVTSPEVPEPQTVRFGWADYPVVNLVNSEGLTATPIKTDDEPATTEGRQ